MPETAEGGDAATGECHDGAIQRAPGQSGVREERQCRRQTLAGAALYLMSRSDEGKAHAREQAP